MAAGLVLLGCLLALWRATATPSVTGEGGGATAPGWGFTHTQYGADGDPAAQRLIAQEPLPQVQALMGWGADNPEPSPGVYDFARLDARVALITRSGGTPIITLCCAPDWMKGGKPGATDWSQLETAPSPAHDADFAALAATVARRYPQVRDFVVWNEFKGFFDNRADQWDAAAYTALYNDVYRALKAVRPDIEVGGPYLPMDSFASAADAAAQGHGSSVSGDWGTLDERVVTAFGYWLQHKAGADFVAVDGSTVPRDSRSSGDPFAAAAKFTAVSRWIHSRTSLPLWWTEWYVEPSGSGWSEPQRDAVLAAGMIALAEGHVAAAFYWNPETGDATCPGCLWSSTGAALPPLALLQGFARWFPPMAALVPLRAADPRVLVLAQAARGVAVNTTAQTLRTTVHGHPLILGPYGVVWFTP
nr:xylan 1,4-beta-xylosidase [Streptacidiphilus neutrinimicus]